MMPGSRAAKRYAKALLSLASEQGAEEVVGTELSQVVHVLSDPRVAVVLALPTLSRNGRAELVEKIIAASSPRPLMANFLRVVTRNDRLAVLSHIDSAYQRLLDRVKGRIRATIQTAAPLSDGELDTIVEALNRLTHKTVWASTEVDESLLGGAVVDVEGRVYDTSLRTQLQRVAKTLAEGV